MRFFPPTARQFEALLEDVAMAAFDFSGTNGQTLAPRRGVVQMGAPFVQILMGGVAGLGAGAFGFAVRLQGAQDAGHFVFQQAALLPLPPSLRVLGFEDQRRGGQIFTDMLEVQQVVPLRPEVLLELGHDPRRAIAHAVNADAFAQPGGLRRGPPQPGSRFRTAQGRPI